MMMTQGSASRTGPNPSGLCQCGCGEAAPLAKETYARYGHVKDQPVRFIRNHHRRVVTTVDYIVDPVTGCWEWQRGKDSKGYGQLRIDGRLIRAHVFFYEKKYGPVPPGKELDHFKCDNTSCCNPDHVRPVTHAEHVRRGPTVKLTLRDVGEIRELLAEPGGLTQAAVAAIYDVHKSHISKIQSRIKWREKTVAA